MKYQVLNKLNLKKNYFCTEQKYIPLSLEPFEQFRSYANESVKILRRYTAHPAKGVLMEWIDEDPIPVIYIRDAEINEGASRFLSRFENDMIELGRLKRLKL